MTHTDVLIVGAGISGISLACHLQKECPDRTYTVLEGRSDIGGTWDLFRYPGVRSDSDMHTLGFRFKPWKHEKSIADGPSIMDYLRETVTEHHVEDKIRFGHRVERAEWDSTTSRWTLTARLADTGESVQYTANFLAMCSGYYSYKGGYEPAFPGADRFAGRIVHPQAWPEDLDYAGKNVVVIGSGATAMTIVPAMASTAAHVTLLQRTPTYVVARPDHDIINDKLRKVLPERAAYAITRRKNVILGGYFYKRTRTQPEKVKKLLLGGVRKALGEDFDVKTHFTPEYNPWDQRMCLLPNGDLFRSIKSGRSSVVTDTIDSFDETGIRLTSGGHVDADVIVSATGLNLVTVGEMEFTVDGEAVDFSKRWTYRGMGYSDVPNLITTFGYVNASWTLRADLISSYVCRLLNHMRAADAVQATPRLRAADRGMRQRPFIEDFSPGYMQRVMHLMPMQGDREPWINSQDFARERKQIGRGPVTDGVMQFLSEADVQRLLVSQR
ncbi:MAG: NAD(P)-binding protein [Actinobacteria bacterium]|uniref:Unannotated protein n=1 Tax=freshwater metagenome TaxID=449393 RepID=A0A6J6V8S6_9ZZZZ|nr:NAD(P)-binding protein [Actinomycetota bacterium]MSZ04922.1 NAD(P)-binding protein [Actinomycetota bacterium]